MPAAAVLFVKSLERMSAFYEWCFGLAPAELAGEGFCTLVSDDWELTLVALAPERAALIRLTEPVTRREESPLKLAFSVESIEEARTIVSAAGGMLDQLETPWRHDGHLHLDCLDPEGNVVQLRERLAR